MRRSFASLSNHHLLLAALLVVTIAFSAFGGGISADAVGTGTLVAWLSGFDLEGAIEGTIRLEGELATDEGEMFPFEVEGTLRGFGVSGILTSLTEGWIGFEAEGRTDDGEAILVFGLLYTSRISVVPLEADAMFVGTYRANVTLGDARHSFSGDFTGSVDGGVEEAETPGTIQFGGSGAIRLDGEVGDAMPPTPLDRSALPEGFLRYLAELGFVT